jgi:hypothetical protein
LIAPVIACDKREAFAQGSVATKQSIYPLCRGMDCFASLAMTWREWNALARIDTNHFRDRNMHYRQASAAYQRRATWLE